MRQLEVRFSRKRIYSTLGLQTLCSFALSLFVLIALGLSASLLPFLLSAFFLSAFVKVLRNRNPLFKIDPGGIYFPASHRLISWSDIYNVERKKNLVVDVLFAHVLSPERYIPKTRIASLFKNQMLKNRKVLIPLAGLDHPAEAVLSEIEYWRVQKPSPLGPVKIFKNENVLPGERPI